MLDILLGHLSRKVQRLEDVGPTEYELGMVKAGSSSATKISIPTVVKWASRSVPESSLAAPAFTEAAAGSDISSSSLSDHYNGIGSCKRQLSS